MGILRVILIIFTILLIVVNATDKDEELKESIFATLFLFLYLIYLVLS